MNELNGLQLISSNQYTSLQKLHNAFLFLLVPSRAPSIFVTNVTSTSLTVQWNPLPPQYHNGRLLGYRVFFRKTANYSSPIDASSVVVYNSNWVTLKNLDPGQRYEISVTAFTSKGDGPRSYSYSVTTGWCGMKWLHLYDHN